VKPTINSHKLDNKSLELAHEAASTEIHSLEAKLLELGQTLQRISNEKALLVANQVKLPATSAEIQAHIQKLGISPLSLLNIASIPSRALADYKTCLESKLEEIKERKKEEKRKLENDLCCICMANKKDTALQPCGHVLCLSCVEMMQKSNRKVCHVCRQPIVSKMSIYL